MRKRYLLFVLILRKELTSGEEIRPLEKGILLAIIDFIKTIQKFIKGACVE